MKVFIFSFSHTSFSSLFFSLAVCSKILVVTQRRFAATVVVGYASYSKGFIALVQWSLENASICPGIVLVIVVISEHDVTHFFKKCYIKDEIDRLPKGFLFYTGCVDAVLDYNFLSITKCRTLINYDVLMRTEAFYWLIVS